MTEGVPRALKAPAGWSVLDKHQRVSSYRDPPSQKRMNARILQDLCQIRILEETICLALDAKQ
jgi:hypothetical protein